MQFKIVDFFVLSNIFTFISGASVFVLSLYQFLTHSSADFTSQSGLMFLSILGLLVSTLGVLGSFKPVINNHKRVIMYWITSLILIAMTFVVILVQSYYVVNVGNVIEDRWDHWYRNDSEKLKNIELDYECCGLKNVGDRSFPKNGNCSSGEVYGYKKACYYPLRREYKDRLGKNILNLSIMFLVLSLNSALSYLLTREFEDESTPASESSRLIKGISKIAETENEGEASNSRENK